MFDRDAILAATNLARLADELLGPHSGSDHRPTWCCPNPTHEQTGRTPPVSVFEGKWGEERWHCHGCGDGGTAIDLVMRAKNVDVRDAMQDLADRASLGTASGTYGRPRASRPQVVCREPSPSGPDRPGPEQVQALDAYVDRCVEQLWAPSGRPAQRWLLKRRGLPAELLAANRVGFDLGEAGMDRPEGLLAHGGAIVLPVQRDGCAIYVQHRVMHPGPDRPRYLNPKQAMAPNPRVSMLEPVEVLHDEVIVTEGTIDALTAAVGGYRSAALLSAAYADRSVALELSRLSGPIVLALDPDDRGRAAAAQLVDLLADLRRSPAVLAAGIGDLNERAIRSTDWPRELSTLVDAAHIPTPHQQIGLNR